MRAALFVAADGPYANLPDVDPYDVERDARTYAGPFPVVAHPPCERWGRYATGGPNPSARRRVVGDDGGCFSSALDSVRRFGGVLEHPAASKAWERFSLSRPPAKGGWVPADAFGYTCHVEQGAYGHPARKATWLYAVRTARPELKWGSSGKRARLEPGFHSKEEAARLRPLGFGKIKRLSERERESIRRSLFGISSSISRGPSSSRAPK